MFPNLPFTEFSKVIKTITPFTAAKLKVSTERKPKKPLSFFVRPPVAVGSDVVTFTLPTSAVRIFPVQKKLGSTGVTEVREIPDVAFCVVVPLKVYETET